MINIESGAKKVEFLSYQCQIDYYLSKMFYLSLIVTRAKTYSRYKKMKRKKAYHYGKLSIHKEQQ